MGDFGDLCLKVSLRFTAHDDLTGILAAIRRFTSPLSTDAPARDLAPLATAAGTPLHGTLTIDYVGRIA